MQKISHVVARVSVITLAASTLAQANDATTTEAWKRHQARAATTFAQLERNVPEVEARAADAVEVSFSEFLAPAGDGGLEFTARLQSLAGKRVRLTGHMVRRLTAQRGAFVLSPIPVTIETQGVCFSGAIPPHAVHVLASDKELPIAYRPGRIAVTGVLELGARREADGQNSTVRVRLDAPATTAESVVKTNVPLAHTSSTAKTTTLP
jgi:hypothetical protein